MPSKLKKAIGAVKDQTSISLAKVASTNYTNLEIAVLKATTHDHIPINDRYVYEVVRLVSSNKIYAAACARAIGKRIGRTRNWIVALKSLMLVLRIFQDGDPYFPREVLHAMKRGAKILNLSSFRDDSNTSPWDYTAFVRTFALYLDERLDCFLTGKLQRRYTTKEQERTGRRGSLRTNEPVRDMKQAVLLDRIAFWQRLLERAIATRPTGAARTNRLVLISLYAIVQESFDLYKDISEGLTLLLDSFFHLQYQSCVSAFQTCEKATKQFQELGQFYSLCRSIGVGRTSEYPSVQKISEELIETLQEFLKDKSSFPSVIKSPNRLGLPPALGSSSARQEAGKFSSGVSEFDSRCTSLEDLISAAETGISQGISIDLEAYSDQFEKKSQQDETFRTSDDAVSRLSTHSLPVSSSMVDLVSLDDWPEQEQETEQEKNSKQEQQQLQSNSAMSNWELVLAESIQLPSTQPEPNVKNTFNANAFLEQEQEQKGLETSSREGWELVLAETATQPTQQTPELASSLHNLFDQPESNVPSTFNTFPEQEQDQKQEQKEQDTSSREDWEIVLTEAATQPMQQKPDIAYSLDSLYNQPATMSPHHYNPFLEESNELAIVPVVADPTATSTSAGFETFFSSPNLFSAAPTFQAAPTFSSQNPNNGTVAYEIDDPFAGLASGKMFNGSMHQQNMLHEQQLWLQQQNKIMEKHMA